MSEKYLINIIKDYTDEQLETLAVALRADKEQTKIGEKLFIDLVIKYVADKINIIINIRIIHFNEIFFIIILLSW